MTINEMLSVEFKVPLEKIDKTIDLIDEGNTIPFIARYRKEVTGNLTDEILRDINERLAYLRNLMARKDDVLRLIEESGNLDDKIREKIEKATTLTEVEDVYLPFRPKKRTRATVAEELGFKAVGLYMISEEANYESLLKMLEELYDDEKVPGFDEAIQYAKDWIAGFVSEDSDIRAYLRDRTIKTGSIASEKTKDAEDGGVYESYYEFSEKIKNAQAHRILAINRGEREKALKVSIAVDEVGDILKLEKTFNLSLDEKVRELVSQALEDSYHRLIFPSIESQVRSMLKDMAEESSIKVFQDNLRPYLMQAPLKGKAILGMDPGFRTGCKLAVISKFGEYKDSGVIYAVEPRNDVEGASKIVKNLIEKHGIELIALGNGTASRETESFISDFLKRENLKIPYVIVSESGASIYSASKLAGEEFPDLDVTIRGAISIARRLQDPLAELVKIEPKHIGVGQYQHDVTQKRLESSLEGVVESCVNAVGVDVNTASIALLKYVAGISSKNAQSILNYKREHGLIKSKEEIKEIKGIGKKTFEQCAGFFRIPESENPLDNTGVHPESYKFAVKLLDKNLDELDINEFAKENEVGLPTLKDIIQELKKPGRDPRDEAPLPLLRQDIRSIDDLEEGTILKGTVRNVVDFGAFVDIGVGIDGLVHISEISDSFISHPSEKLKISDIVNVKVIKIDKKREKIGLSMKI